MKTRRILAISILAVVVVGLPAGVAKADEDPRPTISTVGGSAGSYDSYDDAYFVIDCYVDGNGNTWVLLWDSFDDSTVFVPSGMGPRKDPRIETIPMPE